MSFNSDDSSLLSGPDPDSDYTPYDEDYSYYPLLPSFVRSLRTWKQQSVSFTSLPPEVRNTIYHLACEARDATYNQLTRFDLLNHWMLPSWERGGLMYSCKQVRDEFVPLFITSEFFLLYLGYHEGKSGLETVAWFREAGPALTSHVRRLQVNFGVSWSDGSRTNFAPSDSEPTTRVTDFAGLHIEVSHDGHLELSKAYDTRFDERVLSDIKDKVGQSLKVGLTGLMGFDEFKIMYEVLQRYHPGFVYAKHSQGY